MELNCSLSASGPYLTQGRSGNPSALEDAGGDLATHANICLKFVGSYDIQLVRALSISTGFLNEGCWLSEGAGDEISSRGMDAMEQLV